MTGYYYMTVYDRILLYYYYYETGYYRIAFVWISTDYLILSNLLGGKNQWRHVHRGHQLLPNLVHSF